MWPSIQSINWSHNNFTLRRMGLPWLQTFKKPRAPASQDALNSWGSSFFGNQPNPVRESAPFDEFSDSRCEPVAFDFRSFAFSLPSRACGQGAFCPTKTM
jgi:hypothetical protein